MEFSNFEWKRTAQKEDIREDDDQLWDNEEPEIVVNPERPLWQKILSLPKIILHKYKLYF